MVVFAAAAYMWLAWRQPVPVVSPDEYVYGSLASSIAAGDGLQWHGVEVGLRSPLYVLVTSAWWWFDAPTTSYYLSKMAGMLTLCLTAVPVFLLARSLVGGRMALVPAAMTLAGTWMLSGAGLLTEVLAFPLATASLAATVASLRFPGLRWAAAALGFALLAIATRSQMVVLLAVIAAAPLLDVLRTDRGDRRARMRAHVPLLLPVGGLLVLVALGALVAPEHLSGIYAGLSSSSPSLVEALRRAGEHWIEFVVMCGFVPAAACSLMLSGPDWRRDDVGPLLCAVVPALAIFLFQAGWFGAAIDVDWPIQRYVMYPVPLVLVLATIAFRDFDVHRVPLAAGAVVVITSLVASGGMRSAIEQRAVFATDDHLDAIIGGSTATRLAVAAVIAILAVAISTTLRPLRRPGFTAVPAFAVVTMIVLMGQSQSAWSWQTAFAQKLSDATRAPADWVDRVAAGRQVARASISVRGLFHGQVGLFNPNITRDYTPAAGLTEGGTSVGPTCSWEVEPSGKIRFEERCGPTPSLLYFDDPFARVTLHAQQVVGTHPVLGRVVDGGPQPRVMAIITTPCANAQLNLSDDQRSLSTGRPPCTSAMRILTWLDEPASAQLTFRGADSDHRVRVGGTITTIQRGRTKRMSVSLPRGPSSTVVELDWSDLHGPRLSAADLVINGRRTSLVY